MAKGKVTLNVYSFSVSGKIPPEIILTAPSLSTEILIELSSLTAEATVSIDTNGVTGSLAITAFPFRDAGLTS